MSTVRPKLTPRWQRRQLSNSLLGPINTNLKALCRDCKSANLGAKNTVQSFSTSDEQQHAALLQLQPEGPGLFLRPAVLAVAYAEYANVTPSTLLDTKIASGRLFSICVNGALAPMPCNNVLRDICRRLSVMRKLHSKGCSTLGCGAQIRGVAEHLR